MKFVAVLSIVLLSLFCVNSLKVSEYGNVSSYKVVHVRTAVAEPNGQIQSITVATPRRPNYDPLRIYGVKHLNYNDANVTVTFQPDNFPDHSADSLYITVRSSINQGIHSRFEFYGVHLNDGHGL